MEFLSKTSKSLNCKKDKMIFIEAIKWLN